jgi:hypothetical protein
VTASLRWSRLHAPKPGIRPLGDFDGRCPHRGHRIARLWLPVGEDTRIAIFEPGYVATGEGWRRALDRKAIRGQMERESRRRQRRLPLDELPQGTEPYPPDDPDADVLWIPRAGGGYRHIDDPIDVESEVRALVARFSEVPSVVAGARERAQRGLRRDRDDEPDPGAPHRTLANPSPQLLVECDRCNVWLTFGAPASASRTIAR